MRSIIIRILNLNKLKMLTIFSLQSICLLEKKVLQLLTEKNEKFYFNIYFKKLKLKVYPITEKRYIILRYITKILCSINSCVVF